MSKLKAPVAPLPLHSVGLDTVGVALAEHKSVLDGVLGCFLRAEPDAQGGMLS